MIVAAQVMVIRGHQGQTSVLLLNHYLMGKEESRWQISPQSSYREAVLVPWHLLLFDTSKQKRQFLFDISKQSTIIGGDGRYHSPGILLKNYLVMLSLLIVSLADIVREWCLHGVSEHSPSTCSDFCWDVQDSC